MPTFRYYPPAPEEQRSFLVLFLSSISASILAAAIAYFHPQPGLRGVLCGASLAILFKMGQAAWQLENRGQRSRNASIEVDAEALRLTDLRGRTQVVAWNTITGVDVTGGRLKLEWPQGSLTVGAREVENGMTLTQEILRHLPKKERPSNFIPLEPR